MKKKSNKGAINAGKRFKVRYEELYQELKLKEAAVNRRLKFEGETRPYEEVYKDRIDQFRDNVNRTMIFEEDRIIVVEDTVGQSISLKLMGEVHEKYRIGVIMELKFFIGLLETIRTEIESKYVS